MTSDRSTVPTASKSRNSKCRDQSDTDNDTSGSYLRWNEDPTVYDEYKEDGVGTSERPSKRIRKQNNVTNVSTFGNIGAMGRECEGPDYVTYAFTEQVNGESDTPTVAEAFAGPNASEWEESIFNENNSLFKREVFEVIELPEGRKVLKNQNYILNKLKRLSEERMKFKARL